MEITKRELLFSIIIIIIMLIIGVFISNYMVNEILEENSNYYKAVKINDDNQFKYALDTSVGNILAYGTVKALNPVTMPEITGEWMYLKKITEQYTQKVRIVTKTGANGKTYTKTEIYYEWDAIHSDHLESNQFEFMGVVFDNELNGLPMINIDLEQFSTDNKNIYNNCIYTKSPFLVNAGTIRYKFAGVQTSFPATLEVKANNGTLSSFTGGKALNVYPNKNTDALIEELGKKEKLINDIFWIIWVILITVIVVFFYYKENNWLEH